MRDRQSHGTLLLNGRRSRTSRFDPRHHVLRLTSCYCYRDLFYRPLHANSRKHFGAVDIPTYSLSRYSTVTITAGVMRQETERSEPCAPRILERRSFGCLVVTHFLAGTDLHGHRATVLMNDCPFGCCKV